MTVLTEELAVKCVNDVLSAKRRGWVTVDADAGLDDLELDSLDVAEIFAALEDASDLELNPESSAGLTRVGDLAKLRPFGA
jgi:acyl carrier protein